MTHAIAIVGMACRYPDAASPIELWENVLAQRRAFRRIPPERLNLADYFCDDRTASDRTYGTQAALIEGYEFDRVGFRVAGSTFRAADLVHWLALDIASQALADAGFVDGQGLPRQATGVILGNTLTGEFSRANTMRLRWPYVRRVVEHTLQAANLTDEQRQIFLENLEAEYKAPFPEIGAETLAGNLSNTIAGRICNHFNLQGGGYTVDGACSSSLLAITQASTALVSGDLDVVIAGGVDLSLDPFEIIGFAKAGALTAEEMRVYDVHSAGFIPGEGCGIVVLMRYEDAVVQQRRIYAVIRGWGISSDGSGGITRPEVAGQLLALQQAYRRAQFGIETVTYFEGHGTGTTVGDTTELQALSRARLANVKNQIFPAVISSIKANIGHTKAAAGIAGLIKATMALHTQILPPTTGCEQPHSEFSGSTLALQVLKQGKIWDYNLPLRAGVSAMGFGGINTHIVLEGIATERRQTLSQKEAKLLSSAQDTELILMAAQNADELTRQVEHLLTLAPRLSRAEVMDLAAEMAKNLDNHGWVRAAIVASSPQELTSRLEILKSWLEEGVTDRLNIPTGVFLGRGSTQPRIGFLFPGQGSPVYLNGGAWCRRFESVQQLYAGDWGLGIGDQGQRDIPNTAVAQPAIVTAGIAGLAVLHQLGVTASIAVGHSLGEITAMHWAGAFDAAALVRIARIRGLAMSQLGSPTGAMASIQASAEQVRELLDGEKVAIAGLNSPRQTVISGETTAVAEVVAKATLKGWKTVNLPVSHAFHSPLVAAATEPLAKHLADEDFQPLNRVVVSTVTGAQLNTDEDLRSLLREQITAPVKFIEAVTTAAADLNLLIEVGPGRVLSGLVSEFVNVPVVTLDAGGASLFGLLQAVGAAFVLGAKINHQALFSDRFIRPFNLNWQPKFFVNPCESGDRGLGIGEHSSSLPTPPSPHLAISPSGHTSARPGTSLPLSTHPLDLIRQLVAERAELPATAVKDDSRLLSDLHLNSITVGQLVTEAARHLSLAPPIAPTHYADATVTQVAQALQELLNTGGSQVVETEQRSPQGVDSWIRAFTVELVERPLPRRQVSSNSAGFWQVIAAADYPLANSLQTGFHDCTGNGVIVCLPPRIDEGDIEFLLAGAKQVLAQKEINHFVLVQHGGGGAGFARTLYLEAPHLTICVVDVPINHPQVVEWVRTEALAAIGYCEAHYDALGKRYEPRLRLLAPTENQWENPPFPIAQSDVLLVTGGGKGIAAESALALAKETGVRLVLLGRSLPETDAELANNLQRMTAAGVDVRYIEADVTDGERVRLVIEKIEAEFGTITAILHGAGVNVPKLISQLEETDFLWTLAPKVQGLKNVLAAVNPENLRLLITFGSIIARTGLPGEADYALANEWLANLTAGFQAQHPHCRCLNLDWSIWSGVGMGERLGRVDALMQQGITPIPPNAGVSILQHLVTKSLPATSVVVAGRFGEPPTLKVEQPELPFLRFLEHKRVYYPGVELVVDVELSLDTDPYLNDHIFQGERLFPAVMGLEAIAQVAMTLANSVEVPIFTKVKFNHPVVVPEHSPLTIRLAALWRESGDIEVVLRSEQTAFAVDHFQATCRFSPDNIPPSSHLPIPSSLISLNPAQDLYGGILFHSGRFCRLGGYRMLKATECLAEITANIDSNWFGQYLPPQLVLGDAAARDTAIHALQACIPHATILPVAVEEVIIYTTDLSGIRLVYGQERSHVDESFIYDLEVRNEAGTVLERWQGLHLKLVKHKVWQNSWVEPLLGPYIERRLKELIKIADLTVVVDKDASVERCVRSDRTKRQTLGANLPIFRRPDGKPEVIGDKFVSTAHTGDLTLTVAGSTSVSCDVETVVSRSPQLWQDLLGPERFMLAEIIAQQVGEDQDTAATRIWTANECLHKAGAMVNTPLMLMSALTDGWILLSAGTQSIATFITSVGGDENRLVLAVLMEKSNYAKKL